MEAFAIFSLILVSHFPNRWKDLMQYQLLILRAYCHFSSRVWLAVTGLLSRSSCSTFILPVRQPMALLWSHHMTCPSCQVPPRPSFIANPGIRGVTWLCSLPAATLTSAVCAQAFIGQSPVLTSWPKSAVTSPNSRSPNSRSPSASGSSSWAKAPVVEPISGCLPWVVDSWRILHLVSVIVIRLAYLVWCDY